MTHLNTNHHLPVRTGASPMEDAIVQQVEWYMGRVNLEKDGFLKQKMDDDLWVSLDVILSFPKMIRMGVTDKRRVATLLNARSTVVEVDEKTARIRPAWARRSTLVIHNVPVATRREQVAALFHIPSPTADPNSTVPPSMTHPAGLVSIQLYTDTVWVAMFDSPSGAEAALPLVMHKTINGQEVIAEVHVENALPPARSDLQQARSQVYQPTPNVHHDPANSNHPSYPQMPPIMSAP
ncbi:La-related protein 4 [Gracilariopsis chorda]|uniref:La-related protein 4 n=1 Tax=Gracilariopsis chorda TaxID=448386 RepID=A0A2V3IK94_9FLOR|nr:La-related protein 4 [Gracilariopsis chorda]|eukprot:PXF42468.1 La-related protein 4 [Gracilariopsis chorda]